MGNGLIPTAQNNSFVQLASVHPGWCLLHARGFFALGVNLMFFLLQGHCIIPCQFLCGTVLRLLSSIERGTPSGGAPAHFASFYPFYSLQAFTAALRASVSLQGFCLRFSVQARLARLLSAPRASAYVFQCKHG